MKTRVYISEDTNPYHNLAVEEYLLHLAEENECILYLWQNRRTVVIGRNQNALKECKAHLLESEGGFLARRLSGGGCVYHDLGNLNFTFIAKEHDYSIDRQLSVIIKALETYGLNCEKTGRNDICIDEKKFSGNAFYKHMNRCYHHGTILVDVDLNEMSRYLNVSAEKLKAHSISSVKSRIVNLKSLNDKICISGLQSALIQAFCEIYAQHRDILPEELDSSQISQLTEKYASCEWRFGKSMEADYTMERRFPWGEVSILLKLKGNTVADVRVYSDALEGELAETIISCLTGAAFERDELMQAVAQAQEKLSPEIQQDIICLIKNQELW